MASKKAQDEEEASFMTLDPKKKITNPIFKFRVNQLHCNLQGSPTMVNKPLSTQGRL